MAMERFDITIKVHGKEDDMSLTRVVDLDPCNIYDASLSSIIRGVCRGLTGQTLHDGTDSAASATVVTNVAVA